MNGASMLDTPAKLFIAGLLLLVPALMVCLSMILKPSLSRILNIVFGSFFSLFVAWVGLNSISQWRSFYVFYAFVEVLLTGLIVWYAWRWERVEVDGQ